MHFSNVEPRDLIRCLRTNIDYNKYIEDTEETIDKLDEELKNETILTEENIFKWFLNKLKMRYSKFNGSLYRAFLCLKTDEIFNLRIANHNSTISGAQKSWRDYGQPDIEYHLILEKVPLTNTNNTPIEEDCIVLGTPILVNEYDIADFCDYRKRCDLIDEIVDILENGSSNNPRIKKITESYCRKYNIVEYDVDNLFEKQILKTYISECVKETLLEEGFISRVKNAWNAFWNDSSQQTQPIIQYKYRNVSQQPTQGNQTTNTVQQPAQTQTPVQGNQNQPVNTTQQPTQGNQNQTTNTVQQPAQGNQQKKQSYIQQQSQFLHSQIENYPNVDNFDNDVIYNGGLDKIRKDTPESQWSDKKWIMNGKNGEIECIARFGIKPNKELKDLCLEEMNQLQFKSCLLNFVIPSVRSCQYFLNTQKLQIKDNLPNTLDSYVLTDKRYNKQNGDNEQNIQFKERLKKIYNAWVGRNPWKYDLFKQEENTNTPQTNNVTQNESLDVVYLRYKGVLW